MSEKRAPKTRLIKINQASEQYDVSERTIRRRISDGSLTGYRLGKRIIRVDPDEVAALFHCIPSAKAGDAA